MTDHATTKTVHLDLTEHQADMLTAALGRYIRELESYGPAYAQDVTLTQEIFQILETANPVLDQDGNIIDDFNAYLEDLNKEH